MLHFSKVKAYIIVGVVLLAGLMALPNLLDESTRETLPGFLPNQPVTLGLDLQGGSHVLLEVDTPSLKDVLGKQLVGDIRLRLRDAKIRYANLKRTPEGASVNIPDAAKFEQALTILRGLSQPVDTGLFGHIPELDSMAVAGLLTEMEDRLDILIEDDDVDGEMLETYGGLLAFAEAKVIKG